ncbi:MAG: S24/S26 family peptidase [Deltaproteobacteria bacterium]
MWPTIRDGDLVVFSQVDRGAEIPIGRIAVAVAGGEELVAHRVRRVFGLPGQERVVLAGDLAQDDAPRQRADLRGLVELVYRPGKGFVEPGPKPELGLFWSAVFRRLAMVERWARRRSGQDLPPPQSF